MMVSGIVVTSECREERYRLPASQYGGAFIEKIVGNDKLMILKIFMIFLGGAFCGTVCLFNSIFFNFLVVILGTNFT